MADANEILSLGMDAARDGNREEARNLFTLLTRQDPDNIQAWLWLAGVSDDPRQRRAALERALEIDPQNDMALRGLRALNGVQGGDRRSLVEAVKQTTSNLFGRRGGTVRPSRPLSQYDEELTRELESVESDLYEDDDEPRGPGPVMWGILAVLVLVLVYFLANQFMGPGEETADGSSLTDSLLNGIISTPTLEMPTAAPEPTAEPTLAPSPITVVLLNSENTATSADGWQYGVRSPIVSGDRTYRFPNTPPQNGSYYVVVVLVQNSTGVDQAIPADFFVLQDDQGRTYNVNVERTQELLIIGGGRGVVSDIDVGDIVYNGGALQSIAIIFDIHPDATNLRLYGGSNRSEGWLVAETVQ
ncbi:MAG: tetratricopeptide repeat protein [Roseiflexaceae bacterium]